MLMKESRFFVIFFKTLVVATAVWLLSMGITARMDKDLVELLDRAGILLGLILAGLAAAGGLLAIVQKTRLTTYLQNLARRREYANVRAATEGLRTEFEAVVLPVSNREVPEWILTHLRPRIAALLYTEQSEATALGLLRQFGDQVDFIVTATDIEQVRGFRLENPNEVEESRKLVRFYLEEIQKRGIEPRKIVVDTTGGKVPMSLGAFQAAEQVGAASMYVVGKQVFKERPGFIVTPEDIAAGEVIMMNRPG